MFNIPDPGRYRLARPPLSLAVVQVNFPVLARLNGLDGIASVQERLGRTFPYMEKVQVNVIDVNVAAPAQTITQPSSTAWKFTDDAGWTAIIEASAASVFVGSNYESVDEVAGRFGELLDALIDGARVARFDRIGVRYLNVAEAGSDSDWMRWFRRELVGWIGEGLLSPHAKVNTSINQSFLTSTNIDTLQGVTEQMQGAIRNGLVPAGTTIDLRTFSPPAPITSDAYLLDMDFSIQQSQSTDKERMINRFRLLHSQVDRFFRWSLTDDGMNHFGAVSEDHDGH